MSPALLLSCGEQSLDSTSATQSAQWNHHGGDHSSSKYAPFDQINADNFEQLEVAWRWESADLRLPEDQIFPTGDYRATPIYVNGIIYTATNHSQVVALDPMTGEELWLFDPEVMSLGRPISRRFKRAVLNTGLMAK